MPTYFDSNENKITSCKVAQLKSYITKEELKATGPNFIHTLNSKSLYINSEDYKEEMYYRIKTSMKSTPTGTLNFDGDAFNIVEVSYMNYNLVIAFNSKDVFSFNEAPTYSYAVNLLYKFELDANGETYHFDMTLNDENLDTEETKATSLEYNLFNSENKKIGTIQYVVNEEEGIEKFEVYDLDGNKV